MGKLRSVSIEGALEQAVDIGNSFASWNGESWASLQVNCPRPEAVYFAVRWTQPGARHLGAISCYAGGDNSATPKMVLPSATRLLLGNSPTAASAIGKAIRCCAAHRAKS